MADSTGPGPVSGVTGTPPLRRIRRSGERKTKRRQQRDSGKGPEQKPDGGKGRKGRYLDEHC